jgi:hypothetical protein
MDRNMRKFIICLPMLMNSILMLAQSSVPIWAINEGSDVDAISQGVCMDSNGNTIITGSFSNRTIKFGSNELANASLAGESDIFLVKYQTNGDVMWAKKIGKKGVEKAYGVATDKFDNIFVVGSYTSPVLTFGSDTLVNKGSNTSDIVLFKFDSNGNAIWARSIGGTDNEEGFSVATDKNNSVLITGSFSSNVLIADSLILNNNGNLFTSDIFFAKYDTDGNRIWLKNIGGNFFDEARGITVDKDGNMLVTGFFNSLDMLVGSINLINAGNNTADAFIAKYDSNGNALWAKSIGGPNDDIASSVITTTDGNLTIAGYFKSTSIAVGSKILVNAGKNTSDAFIVKYDSAGNELLAISHGGKFNEFANSIVSNASGELIIAGCEYDSITKSYHVKVIKYDVNGTVVWKKSTKGEAGEIAQGLCTDASGNVFVTGRLRFNRSGSVNFGNNYVSYGLFGSHAAMRPFLVKYDNTGSDKWAKASTGLTAFFEINATASDSESNIYVTGGFYGKSIKIGNTILINSDTTGETDDFFIAKYNSSGKVMWVRQCKAQSAYNGRSIWGIDVATDHLGNVIVTGSFTKQQITFGNYTIYSGSFSFHSDIFLVKYDSTGTVLWAKGAGTSINAGGGADDNYATSVSTDKNGNIAITGTFRCDVIVPYGLVNKYNHSADVFTAKYGPDGKVLWARGGGTVESDYSNDGAMDMDGNVLITGYFAKQDMIFGTDTLKPNPLSDQNLFLVKYDALGNLMWKKGTVNKSNGNAYCQAVTTDKNNNVIISGIGSEINFDSLTINAGGTFVVKYSPEGKALWANAEASPLIASIGQRALVSDADGNIFTSGVLNFSSGTFGPFTFNNSGYNTYDAVLIEYDMNGKLLGGQSFSGKGDDDVQGMCIDAEGNIIIGGDFESDELKIGSITLKRNTNSDLFLCKFNKTVVGIKENTKRTIQDFTVYPNPTNGQITIISNQNITEIQVSNLLGQVIYQTKLNNEKEFLFSFHHSGIYFITATSDKQCITKKVIVN